MMGGGMGLLGFGGIGMILFWVFLVAVVVLAVRSFMSNSGADSTATATSLQTPQEALQMRYAKGEIGKDEYEETRRALSA